MSSSRHLGIQTPVCIEGDWPAHHFLKKGDRRLCLSLAREIKHGQKGEREREKCEEKEERHKIKIARKRREEKNKQMGGHGEGATRESITVY